MLKIFCINAKLKRSLWCHRNLWSPPALFLGAWVLAATMQKFAVSKIMVSWDCPQYFFLAALGIVSIIAFIPLYFKSKYISRHHPISDRQQPISILAISALWVILIGIHIAKFKSDTPLFGEVRYTDYAIQPFTGLLNSLTLLQIAIVSNNVRIVSRSFTKVRGRIFIHLIFLLVLFLVPLVQLNRQVLIGGGIIFGLAIFSGTRIRFKQMAIFSGAVVGVLFGFGLLGSIRSGNIRELSQVDLWPQFVPEELIWPYMYIATPINNLFANLSNANFLELNLGCIFSDLAPSFLRAIFFDECTSNSLVLVHPSFNVGTIFATLIPGVGLVGSFYILCILLFTASILYRIQFNLSLSSQCRFWLFCAYEILAAGLLLSIFANLVLHVVYLYAVLFCLCCAASQYIGKFNHKNMGEGSL